MIYIIYRLVNSIAAVGFSGRPVPAPQTRVRLLDIYLYDKSTSVRLYGFKQTIHA